MLGKHKGGLVILKEKYNIEKYNGIKKNYDFIKFYVFTIYLQYNIIYYNEWCEIYNIIFMIRKSKTM